MAGGLLLDGDRGRESFDRIDVGLLHQAEELPRVGGQRLHVTALAFGINGIERERRLPRSRQPGDDCEPIAWYDNVDVAEVVLAGAAYNQRFFRHSLVKSRVTPPDSSGQY